MRARTEAEQRRWQRYHAYEVGWFWLAVAVVQLVGIAVFGMWDAWYAPAVVLFDGWLRFLSLLPR